MDAAAIAPHRRPDVTATRSLRRRRAVAAIALLVAAAAFADAGPANAASTRLSPTVSAVGGSSANLTAARPSPASTQTNVQMYVNAHRRSRGLAPLAMSAALTNAAQSQANYMASTGRMTHTGSGGSTVGTRVTRAGYRWSMVGENIAYGQTSSSAVVYAWLMSPPHAANMFNPRYTQMGVGVAYAHGVYWWCLVLARPG